MRGTLLALCLCAAGCRAHLDAMLIDPGALPRAEPADPARFDYQVLLQEDRWAFRVDPREVYTEYGDHQVLKVLTESGRSVASQKFLWPAKTELMDLRAQVVSPDGRVERLQPSQRFWTEASGEEGVAQLAFQLPNVQVGSVVEFHYVVSVPILLREANRTLSSQVPIAHYRMEIDVETGLGYVVRAYHVTKQIHEEDALAYRQLTWAADDIEALSAEDFVSDESARWLYRNTEYALGEVRIPIASGWDDVYRGEIRKLSSPYFSEGFNERLGALDCPDARCIVQRAWSKVHELTDTTETGDVWDARPLKTVVASHYATRHEQAVLFREFLAQAGLASDLVFVTGQYGIPLDTGFPTTLHDDVVVWVRPARGLPQGMFVDASCEECQPGVVRDVIDHGDGVVAWGVWNDEADEINKVEPHGRLTLVAGEGRAVGASEVEFELQVAENGDLEVEETWYGTGATATGWRKQERRQERAVEAELARGITQRFPTAKLERFAPLSCNKSIGRCTLKLLYRVPSGATRAGDQLLVPLRSLGTQYDKTFTQESRTREIHIREGNTTRETLRMKLPKGWKVLEAPRPFDALGAGFTTHVSVAQEEGAWVLKRELKRTQGHWPISSYRDARAAVRGYADVRQQSVVLGRE